MFPCMAKGSIGHRPMLLAMELVNGESSINKQSPRDKISIPSRLLACQSAMCLNLNVLSRYVTVYPSVLHVLKAWFGLSKTYIYTWGLY